MACAGAARGGDLGVLRGARERGCPWEFRTCSRAVDRGHFEVVKWARKNYCRWDDWTAERAEGIVEY